MGCENPEMAKPCQHRAECGNRFWEPGNRIMLSYLSTYEKWTCLYRCRFSGLDIFAKLSRYKLKTKRCVQDGKAFLVKSPKAETAKGK